ncbi:hypothetical protein F53441_11485 [Fusarium austroafricanum]|uniref:Uncharacterized protein n=1 Tax=Fusarium austroafricanum TaxID=2364996 RepID=A0A8H4NSZ6_9HYPO|nr:hypothetical protein F53441_11485 [Fusarium austroafricanum]
MGCSPSKPVGDDDSRAPRPAKKNAEQQIDLDNIAIPEVTWEKDESWTKWFCEQEQQAIDMGRHDDFLNIYKDFMFHGARAHLTEMFPECDATGTIENMGERHVCTGAGVCRGNDRCKFPTQEFLVLDASYSGIVHSFALMIAKPPTKPVSTNATEAEIDSASPGEKTQTDKQQSWIVPGAELDSPDMRGAKHTMLKAAAQARAKGINTGHAIIQIFIGAELVTCRFDASPKPPTVNSFAPHQPKERIKALNGLVKDTKKAPNAFRGFFAPHWFRQIVRDASNGAEGVTVWDEGPLPIKLPNGLMYHEPTRLLVTRAYDRMAEGVEETSFTVTPPPFPGTEDTPDPEILVRKVDPSKEPGGIIRISLIIGISKSVLWPKLGDYAKTSVMQAGEKAVLEYAKNLHAKGVLDRCGLRVHMGTDDSIFKFVADPIHLTPAKTRALPRPSELGTQDSVAAAPVTRDPMADKSLETDWNLTVAVRPKHELMGSESQFQAIKQYMKEKAKTRSPEELRAMALCTAPLTGRFFLEVNFPGCEVSEEGPFPVVLPDGTETVVENTLLMLARDPKQEPSSIIAAMNLVPLPNGEANMYSDKSWLETPVMKEADERLLQLLKRLNKEGKVSKVDCMAVTMMVKDATIYKFVDGERFEDYSDERMAQVKWG